jgi:hypothetical protein
MYYHIRLKLLFFFVTLLIHAYQEVTFTAQNIFRIITEYNFWFCHIVCRSCCLNGHLKNYESEIRLSKYDTEEIFELRARQLRERAMKYVELIEGSG